MALKTLIFGTDDLYPSLKPFYEAEIKRGNLEIVAYADFEGGKINIFPVEGGSGRIFELAIISSRNDFYNRMKFLEAQGVPRNRIIDGRVFFRRPNLDLLRLINEGVAYSQFNSSVPFGDYDNVGGTINPIYPRVYTTSNNKISLNIDIGGYINSALIIGDGFISVGKYCSISWNECFKLDLGRGHDYREVSTFDNRFFGYPNTSDLLVQSDNCKILIGNDVWIGCDCILK